MADTVLIVDDEKSILASLAGVLSDEGYQVLTAENGAQALDIIREDLPNVVMLDIWLPGMDGIEVLEEIRRTSSHLPVIMISGHGSIETAVKATKLGAFDFIEKPLALEKVVLTVDNALKMSKLEEENLLLRQKVAKREITGRSDPIQQLKKQIEIVAPTNAWVLITGENGTGKELVANSIHEKSKRGNKPLVEVNCAAIPEELIESELFGHEKGAFTGASAARRGKFDLANEGTLFLDEIGDMSLKTQSKILRILQEEKFARVGGSKTIGVDVRVIAATNKNLEELIEKGEFREDLYYRLNVIPIHVPPLRHRLEDLPLLCDEFLEDYAAATNGLRKTITGDGIKTLMAHHWPGNVRELKNIIERLVILTPDTKIGAGDITPFLSRKPAEEIELFPGEGKPFKDAKQEFEREYLRRKLAFFRGNISKTAQEVGIERSHLHKKLKALGLLEDKE
jgi:two-component system, NtrC family, nitrogen regulation response regulator NtrX